MFNVEVSNPMNGAAYQVLFERYLPAYCSTRERQAEILSGFKQTMEWAATQPPDVLAAYQWATNKLTEDLENRLKINDLGNQVQSLVKTIPRPPETNQ
ncbi:hypothetical protein [Rhizobium rhizogenes]|uniref:hypothetical protein n=1 Tax=Rhizobium rhizogenes TaxID=359 RepID=UPI001571ABF6|nr:hypothetical protein [Rhizobium rhizogenes]NTG07245.1 hypothetical protein [Rhizobium rhizogenes]